jgi:outer membrane biosynthesis protein TonB
MRTFLIALFVLGAATTVAAQDRDSNSISTARELYASARYDEALAMLNGLRPSETSQPNERKTIEQYRSLCLLALGRGEEAESAIAAVVTADPFFLPTESEASPRVRSAFTDVRTRLLPGIAQTRYSTAKQAYDRKEHAAAEKLFRELLTLLNDPQMNGRMGDMRTLATGFLDLAAAAAAPPPEPKKPEPPPVTTPPPAPVPSKPVEPRIYGGEEPGVVAPVAIRQTFPNVPTNIAGMTKERGLLEVVIDEQGRVSALSLRTAIHPVYDTLLLNAARDWRYRPATMNGTPVRYRKLIQVTLPRR